MTRVVVVGAGVAGLTFARKVARAGVDVVVLESGGRNDVAGPHAMFKPELTHVESTVLRTVERGPEWYPRGRGIGGGALINGRLAMPGRPADWNSWASGEEMSHWSWRRVEPLVRSKQTEVIGQKGEWGTRFLRACARHGYERASARVFVDSVFDDPLSGVEGGIVRAHAHVDELVVAEGNVRGVRLSNGDVIAADQVVLAAGALASPSLAMRAGVVSDSNLVGLKDHPAVTLEVLSIGGEDRGVGLVVERGDTQIVTLHELGRVKIVGVVLRVHSRGVIERNGANVSVDFRMLSDYRDQTLLAECVDDMLRIVADLKEPAVLGDVEGGPPTLLSRMSTGQRAEWLKRNVSGVWHAGCSMAMGDVVDPDGKIFGSENVWCCDASIMVDLPRSPTQLPTMIVAEIIAERFLSRVGSIRDSG
jgi:choline dehydrogenase